MSTQLSSLEIYELKKLFYYISCINDETYSMHVGRCFVHNTQCLSLEAMTGKIL